MGNWLASLDQPTVLREALADESNLVQQHATWAPAPSLTGVSLDERVLCRRARATRLFMPVPTRAIAQKLARTRKYT